MTPSASSPKGFQVSIVGGGVCGLACAIALEKAGVPVQLFEAAVGTVGIHYHSDVSTLMRYAPYRLPLARLVQALALVYAT